MHILAASSVVGRRLCESQSHGPITYSHFRSSVVGPSRVTLHMGRYVFSSVKVFIATLLLMFTPIRARI